MVTLQLDASGTRNLSQKISHKSNVIFELQSATKEALKLQK